MNKILVEICCRSVSDCIIASKYPIDRIELNSCLELGGITPTIATLTESKKVTNVPICCMVRPRGAGFCYSDIEFNLMLVETKMLLDNGADGIVFGFLTKDNHVDVARTKQLTNLIHEHNAEAIYHKAFDSCNDLDKAILDLIECGIDRILTSGGAPYPDILLGCDKLKQYNALYANKIELLPGGGVRSNNIVDVIKNSNCTQIHMTSKKQYYAIDEPQLIEILDTLHAGISD